MNRDLKININGSNNSLLHRVRILRNAVKKSRQTHRTTWFKKIFRLHVFPGDFEGCLGDDFVFDVLEENQNLRHYQSQVNDLNAELQQSRSTLKETQTEVAEQQSENRSQREQLQSTELRASNVSNRLTAAERNSEETLRENSELKAEIQRLEAERRAEEKRKEKRLGRKRIHELCPGAVKLTKSAYKKRFVEEINKFGETRGLVVEKLILRDEAGEPLVINSERANTYENLTPAERKKVERASFWKDSSRISDRVYAAAVKDANLPPSSHVKAHEKVLNAEVGEIHQVI